MPTQEDVDVTSLEVFKFKLDLEQPDLLESIPSYGREWDWMVFKVSSSPNHSMIL